jgi:hypothetical protein
VSLAVTISGVLVFTFGVFTGILGMETVSAGRGGYGHGPFPMVPTSRDDGMILLGVVAMVIGATLVFSGYTTFTGAV